MLPTWAACGGALLAVAGRSAWRRIPLVRWVPGLVAAATALAAWSSERGLYLVLTTIAVGLAARRSLRVAGSGLQRAIAVSALCLVGIGMIFQTRLAGPDNGALLAMIVGIGCIAMAHRISAAAAWAVERPWLLVVVGLALYAAGLAGGAGASRTEIPFVLRGVVVAEAARFAVVGGIAVVVVRRRWAWQLSAARSEMAAVALATLGAMVLIGLTGDIGGGVLLAFGATVIVAVLIERVWPVAVGGGVMLASAPALLLVSDHVRERLGSWQQWTVDGKPTQQLLANFAIADGGLLGQGVGNGDPRTVPVVESDFVVAGLVNEVGIVGLALVSMMLIAVVAGGLLVASRSLDSRLAGLAAASCVLLGSQAVVNLLGVGGLAPLTGVPFPFLSRAGTYLVVTCLAVSVLVGIPCGSATNTSRSHGRRIVGGGEA